MSGATRMGDLLRETQGMELGEFLARSPYPFLVRETTRPSGEWPALPPEAGKGERGTARVDAASIPTGDGSARDEVLVYPVCPADPDRQEGAVVIGRGPECDVVIDDASVSTRHAEVTLRLDDEDEKEFFVTDLGSSNGTFLDGTRLAPATPRRIDDSMSLRLGPAVKLQFFTAPAFHLFLGFYRRIPPKGKR